MKRVARMGLMGLMGLLAMGLLASCKPEKEKPFVPIEPELQEDYTETAFGMNMEMVYVKGGEFMMGYTKEQELDIPNIPDSSDKKNTRKTKLDSYHIGRYEVTQAQWKAVVGTEPSHFKGDSLPVEKVSWEDAQEFCKKLSEQTGKKYVLPTEAMWEYAARGGVHKTNTKYAGGNNINEVAWYKNNSNNKTHPVGSKKANALGLYDMSGNVAEWCLDWFGDMTYLGAYDPTDDYNPQGPTSGMSHMTRGGYWSSVDASCQVSNRINFRPDGRLNVFGFRVAVLP